MINSHKAPLISLLSLVVPVLFLVSCRSAATNPGAGMQGKNMTMSQEEQDKKAFALFEEYYGLTGMADRGSVLSRIEAIFVEIINEYPKAALGQQSYVNLIQIYLNDYTPPQYDRAEELYQRCQKIYPGSRSLREIEGAMFQAYSRDGKWEKVLKLSTPSVKRYIETRQLEQPRELFYYAEAKFNMGDITEAEKGYKIIYSIFPGSNEGVTSRQRLLDMQKKEKQQK